MPTVCFSWHFPEELLSRNILCREWSARARAPTRNGSEWVGIDGAGRGNNRNFVAATLWTLLCASLAS